MHNKLLFVIIIISIVIGACTLTRGHFWGDDFAWYILQARSIVNGTTDEFIATSAFTNSQSTTHLGPLAYPWGYPLILAPVYAIKGIHPLALKLPGLLFFAGFLVCLYRFGKDRLSPTENLLLVSLFAFNPLLLQFLDQILSDIPFLFFSMLSFLLMTQEGKQGISHYAWMGASVFCMAFLRTTGALLLGCFLIVEFFKLVKNRTDRMAVIEIVRNSFVVCFVFILLWILNTVLFPSGEGSYLSQYTDLIGTARAQAFTYFHVFSWFFGESTVRTYVYYFLLIFFLLGAWARRKQELVLLLFFLFWLIVHVTYPYMQLPRYIFPLLPIFIYFTFQGMRVASDRLPARTQRTGQAISYGFWILIVGFFLFVSSQNAYVNLQNDRTINGPFDPYSTEVYDYIKKETRPGSVVIFFKPRVMVMLTEHPTIMSTECERMYKGDYLVLSRKVGENQQIPPEDIGACNLPLNQVLKNSRFIVYQIRK